MADVNEHEFEWDSPIEHDSEFEPVPAGDYDFEVLSFERQRHNGSEKLPPCWKAALKIRITSAENSTTLTHNLFLHSRTEGMLCAFFTAIGQRKKGERFTMDWSAVPGSRGRCKVGIRDWNGNDGSPRTSNQIERFYEPGAAKFEAGKF